MLDDVAAEAPGCQGLFRILAAPQGINCIEVSGGYLGIRLKPEIAFRLHELHNVVAIPDGFLPVGFGPLAGGKVEILLDQPSKTFQSPQKDAAFMKTIEIHASRTALAMQFSKYSYPVESCG